MPRAYSLDLRTRVIAACQAGGRTRAEVARQFDVAEATLYEWLRRWDAERALSPRPHAGGRSSALDAPLLAALAAEHSHLTLAELAAAYEARTGRRYSVPRISTALKMLRAPTPRRPDRSA